MDAFVAGLNATGLAQVRVMDYREHAIGSGANAQAVAYLELRVGDHTLFGVGVDADILTASLKGILSGLARAGCRHREASRARTASVVSPRTGRFLFRYGY